MLENPQDESVVRWGDQGDSFVVLEVRRLQDGHQPSTPSHCRAERKVYETHITEALQAQQLCQLCQTAQQVRLPQSTAQ